jgi:predicted ribosomally synthesized peptide with nif11-like leader
VTKQDALAFLNSLARDRELSRRIAEGGKEEVLRVAREAGLSTSWEELEAVVREIKGAQGELSEDALELIAGGLSLSEIQSWVGESLARLRDLYDPFSKR